MKIDKRNIIKYVSCSAFGLLYVLVACISLICSVEFFRLAHAGTMSWVLAIGFELGAMCCLLSTLILPKEKQALVWLMFVLLTLFQMMGNTYAAYSALDNFQGWIELFGLEELEPIAQKRVLACISGAILPLVALGFVRTMVNVLQPKKDAVAEEPIAEPLPEPEQEPVPEPEPMPEQELPDEPVVAEEPEMTAEIEKPESELASEPEPIVEKQVESSAVGQEKPEVEVPVPTETKTGEVTVEPKVTRKVSVSGGNNNGRVWDPSVNKYMDEK